MNTNGYFNYMSIVTIYMVLIHNPNYLKYFTSYLIIYYQYY